uniref:Uncharacterized protein n=1 Tax=Thalassionema nitzschioides TaxID=33649 RepID=A0A6V1CPE2_9STRA|mmetsp:Transcript_1164/g.1786  ORF Transcript_1164/g.1786 Transcript_1164/m.1786 type:complete len:116 (+) Transcript_1164:357-704(+)
MEMLFPPLEGTSSTRVAGGRQDQITKIPPDDEDDVLSPKLKENFNKMRELLKKEDKMKKRNNPAEIEERKEAEAKKQRLAMETALAIEDETSRLRKGIAELEALLAQQDAEDECP